MSSYDHKIADKVRCTRMHRLMRMQSITHIIHAPEVLCCGQEGYKATEKKMHLCAPPILDSLHSGPNSQYIIE